MLMFLFLLVFDWFKRNNCEWLFGPRRVVINGVSTQLHTRVARPLVRRVFIRETVEIPVDTAANVAVRLPYVNMHAPNADWLTDSREVRPGLLAARTLLSGDDKHAAIRFINLSGDNQIVRQGLSLSVAAPCCANHTETRPPTTPPMQTTLQRASPVIMIAPWAVRRRPPDR